ncbi:MAG: L,D-transpeptidase family protein [Desulfuromonadales bacterium]|nr:L,D-transpeptidase family protein [Desulfuromonadales bacterium]
MNRWKALLLCVICLVGLSRQRTEGAEFFFSQGVGGVFENHTIRSDDSLVELARHYDVGYSEITAANPRVDPFIPQMGTSVTIPRIWILPDIPLQRGIVINLSEMRLYFFHPKTRELVETFPVGIGDEGWDTPTGTYRIIEKVVHPAWHVPASIRRQRPELPKVLPPGGDNPLGSHALRLSSGSILIHGTNRPFGIGRRVSHGCIHLYPEDIATLYKKVPLGTSVTIVRQQVKVAEVNGWVVVEVHGDGGSDLEHEALTLLKRRGLLAKADIGKLKVALRLNLGTPTDITRKE